jgi:hypothetical protein
VSIASTKGRISEQVWLASFMQYDLGFIDQETDRVTSAENPFGAKVLAYVPGKTRYLCGRNEPLLDGGPCRDRTYDQEIKSLLLYQLS